MVLIVEALLVLKLCFEKGVLVLIVNEMRTAFDEFTYLARRREGFVVDFKVESYV